jgi:hypothetical protein
MVVSVGLSGSRNKGHMQWCSSTGSCTCPFVRKRAAPAPDLIHNLQNPSHSAALFLLHLTVTVGSRFSGNVPFRRSRWNAKMAAVKLRY